MERRFRVPPLTLTRRHLGGFDANFTQRNPLGAALGGPADFRVLRRVEGIIYHEYILFIVYNIGKIEKIEII
jgi:hypothetical protein